MGFSRAFVLGCALATMIGCGKVADDGSDGTGTPDPAGTAAPPSATPTPPIPRVPAPTHHGRVLVFGLDDHFGALAGFALDYTPTPSPRDVALGECRSIAGDPNASKAWVNEDAGDIVITMSPATLGPMTLTYDAGTRTYGESDGTGYATPGAPIAVRANGGPTVPAFEGSVAALAPLAALAPRAADTIHSADDLIVRWSTTDTEPVFVEFTVAGKLLACQFGGASGTGTIPGALIHEAFATVDRTGPCQGCGSFTLRRSRSSHVIAGTFDVEVEHFVTTTISLNIAD